MSESSVRSPRLFLVRHGQTTSNTIHALDTALPGADLTPLGREQATEAGGRLAGVSDRVMVLSSFAARAQQTAVNVAAALERGGADLVPADVPSASPLSDATAQQLADIAFVGAGSAGSATSDSASDSAAPVPAAQRSRELQAKLAIVPGVAEIAAGDMEMRNDEDAYEMYHSILGGWLHGNIDERVPGGKTGTEILQDYLPRVLELLDAGRRNNCDVALVSHGAVIRLVAAFLGGVDPDWAYGAYLRNAQVITVEPGASSSASPSAAASLTGSSSSDADAPAASGSAASDSAASNSAQQADDLLTKLHNTMSITSWGDHPLP